MKTFTQTMQTETTPQAALDILLEGNQRFLDQKRENRNYLQQVKETSTGQFPFATVLSCIDSRVPAEMVFDQGIGDLFSIRIAGNFVNDDILGSMEFACKAAGSKVVLVLGHTHCGAVKGACDNVELGNLTAMLKKINPAISRVTDETERTSANTAFVEKVTHFNIKNAIDDIREKSPVLREMESKGEIKIVGGVYDIENGKVSILS